MPPLSSEFTFTVPFDPSASTSIQAIQAEKQGLHPIVQRDEEGQAVPPPCLQPPATVQVMARLPSPSASGPPSVLFDFRSFLKETIKTRTSTRRIPSTKPLPSPSNHPTQPTKTVFSDSDMELESEENKSDLDDFVGFVESESEQEEGQVKSPSRRHRDDHDRQAKNIDILTPLEIPPWVPEQRHYSDNPCKLLQEEIEDYIDYMQPTRAERKMRLLTLERVRSVVNDIWPDAQVHAFGSFETDLYLPSSDVDIVVLHPSAQPPSCLYELANALKKRGYIKQVEIISKARVPIIKGVDALTHFPVDISFNITGGIDAAKIVNQFLDDSDIGTSLRMLLMILKLFLMQRHCNEVFSGGLGSYGLTIMIASFLKSHPRIQTGQIDVQKSIGVLLIEFFELYGKNLFYQQVGVAVDPHYGGYFFNKRQKGFYEFGRADKLAIQDPQDPDNDVGRGSFQIQTIRHYFMSAFNRLTFMIGTYESRTREYKQGHIKRRPRRLRTLLGSILTIQRRILEHRDKVEETWEELVAKQSSELALLKNELIMPPTTAPSSSSSVDWRKTIGSRVVVGEKRRRSNERASPMKKSKSSASSHVIYISDNDSIGDQSHQRRKSNERSTPIKKSKSASSSSSHVIYISDNDSIGENQSEYMTNIYGIE